MTLPPTQRLRDCRDNGDSRGAGDGRLGASPGEPFRARPDSFVPVGFVPDGFVPDGFVVSRRLPGSPGPQPVFIRRLAEDRGAATSRGQGGRRVARRRNGLHGDPVAYSRRFQYTNALIPA